MDLTEIIMWLTGGRPTTLEDLAIEIVYLFPLIVGILDDRAKSRDLTIEAEAQRLLLLALAPILYGWTLFLLRMMIFSESVVPALTSVLIGGYSGIARLRRLYMEKVIR